MLQTLSSPGKADTLGLSASTVDEMSAKNQFNFLAIFERYRHINFDYLMPRTPGDCELCDKLDVQK